VASDEWWVMSGEWRWRAGRQAFRKDPTSIPASRRIARSALLTVELKAESTKAAHDFAVRKSS